MPPNDYSQYFTSYGAAMVGVATAKSPCGPYSYKASWKPLGAESRDEGLFQDGLPHFIFDELDGSFIVPIYHR